MGCLPGGQLDTHNKHQTLELGMFSLLAALLGSFWGHLGMEPNLTNEFVDVFLAFDVLNTLSPIPFGVCDFPILVKGILKVSWMGHVVF